MPGQVKIENKKELVCFETLIKEGKSLKDFDYDKVQLVGGKTPEGIEEKCLEKCKEYLAGNWCEQTLKTIEVQRITGGMLNQMYYCSINQPIKSNNIPQEVIIKFYGYFWDIDQDDKSKIRDLVISLIFSEQGLGPKIYGIFEGGQIQKFYKQRHFSMDDKNNPAIVKKVFKTLAKIHSLDVPIKKNGKQFVELLDKSNPESIERFNKLIEENNCQTLKKYDLKTEFDWIKQIIEKLDSPLVFCHMDYRSSNLMITEPNNELVVCDFDESSYGNRGLDFSKLIKEWNSSHFFLNMDNIEGQPLGDELRPYIKAYVEECQRIHGKDFIKNPNNSVEHIMKEAKVFLLLTYLLYAADMRATRKTENSLNPKVLMEWAETNYKNYITVKGILKEQKLFD